MKKKKKLGLIIGLAAGLVAIGAGAYFLFGGTKTEGTAYVESVKNIMGAGGAQLSGRYSGIVEAKQIVKVKLDSDKKLDTCFVAVGDPVQEGTPLFSYDVDSLTLAYEQLKIDLQGLQNNIATMKDQITDLQKQVKRAKGSTKAELTIQLQTTELSLKKEEYNAKKKQIDVDGAKKVIDDNVVKATVKGTVRSINPPSTSGGDESVTGESSETAYITIVAGDDYHVKGTISEQSVRLLVVGTPVILRSRTDETQIWRGAIESVNTEQAESQQQNMYYYDSGSSGEQTSKYAFYVSLDNRDGLIMGQHIYIEFDEGQEDNKDGVRLPEYYLINEDGRYFVYAANARDRIEKRPVEVGAYDEALGTYEIVSGLTADDRVAFPDENVKIGMTAVDTAYADPNAGGEMTGGETGGDMSGGEMTGGETGGMDGASDASGGVIAVPAG